MQRQMMKSKIHRGSITAADLHYVGSITLDPELMDAADILPNELVHVLDIDNGARFVTYAIAGRPGAREIQINGAAARLVHPGDRTIIISYAGYSEEELVEYEPRVVHLDRENRIARIDNRSDELAAMTAEGASGEAVPGAGARVGSDVYLPPRAVAP